MAETKDDFLKQVEGLNIDDEIVELTVYSKLLAAAETYKQRNAEYGDSPTKFGRLMTVLFPEGVTCESERDFMRLGIFVQIVGKLSRYNFQNPQHSDTMRDLGVYALMMEHADTSNLSEPF